MAKKLSPEEVAWKERCENLPTNKIHSIYKDGKYGLIESDTFKMVRPFEYNSCHRIDADKPGSVCILAGKGTKTQLISKSGEILKEYTFKIVSFQKLDKEERIFLHLCDKDYNHAYVLTDFFGNETIDLSDYREIKEFIDGVAIAKKDSKWGIIDTAGKEILPCIYESAGNFSDGLAKVQKEEDGKYGYIDTTGKEIVPCIYESAGNFSDGLAKVQKEKDGKWGYIDTTGKEIVPCVYKKADDFSSGLAEVHKDGKRGCIDTTGKEIAPCVYDDVYTPTVYYSYWDTVYIESLRELKKDGLWDLIDTSSKQLLTRGYNEISTFTPGYEAGSPSWIAKGLQGVSWVEKNGLWGLIDLKGSELIPCIYDKTCEFKYGFAKVCKNGLWGLVDTHGKEIIPCIYDDVKEKGKCGLFLVARNGRWGYANMEGKEVIKCAYDKAKPFEYNTATEVCLNGKWGCINSEGKEIIPCIHDDIDIEGEGHYIRTCEHAKPRQYALYDCNGKEIVPFGIYNFIACYDNAIAVEKNDKRGLIDIRCNDDLIEIEKNDKWGLIDCNGKELTPLIYNDFNYGIDNYLRAKKDGKWGVLDYNGKEITPFIYEDLDTIYFDDATGRRIGILYAMTKNGKPSKTNFEVLVHD